MSCRELTLVGLVAAFCLIGLVCAEEEEWQQYHNQLFTNEGSSMDKDQVVEILQKLHELYQGKTDEATLRRAQRIDELLELTNINDKKCTDSYIEEVDKLKYFMTAYRTHLHPFVLQQRANLLEFCRKFEASRLMEAVQGLSEKDRSDVEALVKSVDDGEESRYFCEEKQNKVVAGVLSFIEEREGKILEKVSKPDGSIRRDFVFPLIQQHTEGLCDRVVDAIREPLLMYEKFDHTEKDKKYQDEFVAKWHHNKGVCVYVLFHEKDLMEEAYQSIKFTEGVEGRGSLKSKLIKMIKS